MLLNAGVVFNSPQKQQVIPPRQKKCTRPLAMDHFKGKVVFQPSHVSGTMYFFRGSSENFLRVYKCKDVTCPYIKCYYMF